MRRRDGEMQDYRYEKPNKEQGVILKEITDYHQSYNYREVKNKLLSEPTGYYNGRLND